MHGNELRLFQFGDTVYTQPGAYACVVSTRYGLMESEPAMLSLPSKLISLIELTVRRWSLRYTFTHGTLSE